MARLPQPTDFTVKVPDVGTFVFAKRKMRDELAIQVEFARIIDGAEPTVWLQSVGGWLSTLKVLTVLAPDGWDLDEMDPLDEATYSKLSRVFEALTEKERSFRRGPEQANEASSPAAG